jgi:hypothetical protein
MFAADAQMDPHDTHRFKLIVRSSRTVEHMYPAEPDMTQLLREGGTDGLLDRPAEAAPAAKAASKTAPAAVKYPVPKLESAKFLKAKGKTNFWQLTLRVENEQACRLAVQHIENKRKEQTAAKMQQLQKMLELWSSDSDIGARDN